MSACKWADPWFTVRAKVDVVRVTIRQLHNGSRNPALARTNSIVLNTFVHTDLLTHEEHFGGGEVR